MFLDSSSLSFLEIFDLISYVYALFMATLKLLHVLFIFIWVGTLLTLSRMMGYLAKEPLLVQQRVASLTQRMYLLIDLPSMVIAVGLGLCLLFLKDTNWKAPWLHVKLTLAFLLIVCDLLTGWKIVRQIADSSVGYKILHGFIGLLLIGVLIAIYILK